MEHKPCSLGSENPKELGQFYSKVFGKPGWKENDEWFGWVVETGVLMVGPHSEVKGQNNCPGRMMIMFTALNVEEEFARFQKIGATVVAKPYKPDEKNNPNVWLATLADPDGNYIQIASPWEQ
jgi:predicted enzyme related to lactoylglutathione lyase